MEKVTFLRSFTNTLQVGISIHIATYRYKTHVNIVSNLNNTHLNISDLILYFTLSSRNT